MMAQQEKVVGMVAEGIRVISDQGVVTIKWSELMRGHHLVEHGQSFQIGVHVGMHIASMQCANDE